jgi:hypothetical protein
LLVNVKNDCNVVAVKMHTPVFKMMPKISKARTIGKSLVKTGISFLRRFIDLAIGLKSTCHRRWLTKQGRADVHAWSLFIESFNMKSLITTNILETSEQIGLFTDASNIGFKDIFGFSFAC